MRPWFSWEINFAWVSVLGVVTVFLVGRGSDLWISRRTSRGNYTLLLFLFLILFLWESKYFTSLLGYIDHVLNWALLASLISLKDEYKCDLVRFITKWFSVILIVSLIYFIIHLLGIPLPHTIINRGADVRTYTNYFLFIDIEGSIRFQGPFLEPGHMTLGVAPLLFLNLYNVKNKYVLFLFLSQLFSFSLAGYIILIVGFSIVMLTAKVKHKVTSSLLPLVIFAGVLLLAVTVYKENLFRELILERLEWDGSTISGYNRSSDFLDSEYERLTHSDQKWFGTEWEAELSSKGVAGYKLYFVQFGLIGVILVFLSYFFANRVLSKKNTIEWGFLLILLLLIYQNAYPLWWCLLIELVCGNVYLNNQLNREQNSNDRRLDSE